MIDRPITLTGTIRVVGRRRKVEPDRGDGKLLRLKGEGPGLRDGERVRYRMIKSRAGRVWAVLVERSARPPEGSDVPSQSLRTISGGGGPGTGKRR